MEQDFLDGALSHDGFITDQAKCSNIRYGCHMSDVNGCGWIAAYNFLKATGGAMAVSEVKSKLLRFTLLRGLIGTRCIVLYAFLRGCGYRLQTVCGAKRIAALAERAQAGILFYRHKTGWHFVCYLPAGNGRMRFLNAWTGPRDPVKSMDAFLRDSAKSPFLITMSV